MSGKLTDYEVGNAMIHRVADNLDELAEDCKISHPQHAELFCKIARSLHKYGEGMEDGKDSEACFTELNLIL